MKIIINNNSYRSEFKFRTCITHGKYSFTINKKILPQIKIYNISDDDLESIGNDFNTILNWDQSYFTRKYTKFLSKRIISKFPNNSSTVLLEFEQCSNIEEITSEQEIRSIKLKKILNK